MQFIVHDQDATLEAMDIAVFRAYYLREIAARGRADGDGLDVRQDGTRVHITTSYQESITAPGTPGGLYVVDAYVLTLEGRIVQTVRGQVTLLGKPVVDEADLPQFWKDVLAARRAG